MAKDQVLRPYFDPEPAGFTSWLCRDKRREAGLPINNRAGAYPFPREKSPSREGELMAYSVWQGSDGSGWLMAYGR